MVQLNAPLNAFRMLRPFVQPAANLAQRILKRWGSSALGRTAWQGSLHLDRQIAIRGNIAGRVFRRLTERWNEKGEHRSAFHPLSLPRGIVNEEARRTSLSVDEEEAVRFALGPDAFEEQASQDRALESAREHSFGNEVSSLPQGPEQRQPVPRTVSTETSQGSREMQFAQPVHRKEIQRAKWPYRLVSPRPEQAKPGFSRSEMTGHGPRQVSNPSRTALVYSRQVAAPRLAGHLELGGRPILQLQARMPVSSVRFPAALAAEGEKPVDGEIEIPPAAPGWHTIGLDGAEHSLSAFSNPEREGMIGDGPFAARRTVRSGRQPGSPISSKAAARAVMRLQAAPERLNLARAGQAGGSGPTPEAPERFTSEQEWPLFGVLRDLVRPPETGESTALQILRRMWPEAEDRPGRPELRSLLEAGVNLGPGETLVPELRRSMERTLGRELGEVRLHTSALAQTLRAEAFTSGRNIVFAPGRFEPGTPRGLALLGHELTHLGQPLAFKPESPVGMTVEDSQEHAARTQEERILQVIEKGWPEPPAREFQRSRGGAAPSPAAPISGVSMVQRAVEINEVEVEPSSSERAASGQGSSDQTSAQAGADQSVQAGPGQSAGAAGGPNPAANLDALARQVYAILKDRLRAERDRHQLYRS